MTNSKCAAAWKNCPAICTIFRIRPLTTRSRKSPCSATNSRARRLLNNKRAGVVDLVLRPFWRFFRGYILRLGFLDGRAGLLYCEPDRVFDTHALYESHGSPAKKLEVKPSIALVINTYQQPEYLARVLRAVSAQEDAARRSAGRRRRHRRRHRRCFQLVVETKTALALSSRQPATQWISPLQHFE